MSWAILVKLCSNTWATERDDTNLAHRENDCGYGAAGDEVIPINKASALSIRVLSVVPGDDWANPLGGPTSR